jgi:RecA/RadA recombinase
MAKKKEKEEKETKIDLDRSSMVLKDLADTYGEIVSSGQDLLNKEQEILSLSPRLDGILNGGIPEGTATFVIGKPKSGKTTLLLRACAQAQKQNRDVWYIDVEHRLSHKYITGCAGLDPSPDKFHHIHSKEGQILSAEKILTIATKILTDIPRSLVIIDSFGALVTQGEMEGELKGRQRTDLHGLLSLFHRILCPIISINKNYLFGVQHTYANVAPSGPMDKKKTIEGGSSKGQFLSSNKLTVKYFEYWGAGKECVGQKVHWQCDYSDLGMPGGTCESYIRYGTGIDVLQELLMTAVDAGLIKKAAGGGWYTPEFLERHGGEVKKMQGDAVLYDAFLANEEWQVWLMEDLKSLGAI